MVAAVGSEQDKQSARHYTTALHINNPVFHSTFYDGVLILCDVFSTLPCKVEEDNRSMKYSNIYSNPIRHSE